MSESPDSKTNWGFDEINNWHREKGFRSTPHPLTKGVIHCGYHIIVRRDEGELEMGRHFSQNGAHTKGYNATSLGICYMGTTPSAWQLEVGIPSAIELCREWIYNQEGFPSVQLLLMGGHRDFQKYKVDAKGNKYLNPCPNFDVRETYGKYV